MVYCEWCSELLVLVSTCFQVRFVLAAMQKDLFLVSAKVVLPYYCFICNMFKCNRLALLQQVLRVVGTCKYRLNIINFQVRLVLAAMQKQRSLCLQNVFFFHIVYPVKLVFIFEISPVLAAGQMEDICFTTNGGQSYWYL